MSRSYKHNPITKAGNYSAFGKKQASHQLRRAKDIPDGNQYRKYFCRWRIYEYRSRYTLDEWLEGNNQELFTYENWIKFYKGK